MDPLLSLTGVLLLVSGLLSLRSGTRLGVLVPILALAQILVGLGEVLVGIGHRLSGWVGLAVTAPSLTLMLASALLRAVRQRAHRRTRDHSEGARLETYVKYLSGAQRGD